MCTFVNTYFNMEDKKPFTQRLQKILDFYSLSASGLALKIGVQRSSISHIISGRNKPSLDFITKTLSAFDEVEFDWLINGKGAFPKSDFPTPIQKIDSSFKSGSNFKSQPKIEKTENVIQNEIISPNSEFTPQTQNSNNSRIPEKIIILYTDGSFKTYHP